MSKFEQAFYFMISFLNSISMLVKMSERTSSRGTDRKIWGKHSDISVSGIFPKLENSADKRKSQGSMFTIFFFFFFLSK